MRFSPIRLVALLGLFAGCLILPVSDLRAQDAMPDAAEAVPDAPAATPADQPQELLDGIERFKKMDIDGALAFFKEAHTKHPKLSPGEVTMATLLLSMRPQQVRAARHWLEQAVSASPDDPEAYIYIASMALGEGRMCEASLVFAKANSLMTNVQNEERKTKLEPRIHSGLAGVAVSRKDWETAKVHIQSWLAIQPDNAVALQRLAGVLFQNGDPKEALVKLKAAKEANPKVREPSTQLALFYHQANDQVHAKQWMDYAQKSAAADLDTQMVVAQWCLETGDLDKAETLATGAIALDENSHAAKILRGVIALFKKDYTAAAAFFNAVVLEQPRSFPATNNLALALCEQDDAEKKTLALTYATTNFQLNQKNVEAASTLGWVLYKNGDVRRADQLLTSVARTGKITEDTAYFIAEVANQLGRKDQAISALKRALQSTRPFSKRAEAEALLKTIGN